MTENECLRILELAPSYTETDVRRQYRALILKYHPDRNPASTAKFLQVKKAYEELTKYYLPRKSQAYKSPPYQQKYTKQTQQKRTHADQVYKQRVKRDIDWARYEAMKSKKYQEEYLTNMKYGCLAVIVVALLCILCGIIFNPPKKNNIDNYEYENY